MAYRKLGRTSGHRKSMLRNLTTDVIVNGKIVTTEQRAKEVRRQVEKMITLGKKDDLTSHRRAAAYLMDVVADAKEDGDFTGVHTALQKFFDEVAPWFKDRNGGYTRIIKMQERHGDAAKMAVLELVDYFNS